MPVASLFPGSESLHQRGHGQSWMALLFQVGEQCPCGAYGRPHLLATESVEAARVEVLIEAASGLLPGELPSRPPRNDAALGQMAERGVIVATLRECGGNRSEAARRLGISRATLHEKLHKYGLANR